MSIKLCETALLSEPSSKSIDITINNESVSLFVVLKDGHYYAYKNSCPHTGANLDWLENQFLDMESSHIQCATHDALFKISTGECIAGPCVGEYLTPITIEIKNHIIYANSTQFTNPPTSS